MSLSQNLQVILDETLQSFLSMDLSSNFVEQWNRISPNLIQSVANTSTSMSTSTSNIQDPILENPTEDNGSLPDLIPIEEPEQRRGEQGSSSNSDPIDDSTRRIRLWSNVLLDYHNQIHTYQENMRTVFNITEHLLPISETRSYSNSNSRSRSYSPTNRNTNHNQNQNTNTLWQYLLQTPSTYLLEFDATNLLNRNTTSNSVRPTAFQIQTATSLFSYNPQENPLSVTTCPITLEEFREDEMLMRINGCGHIFKASALHRWFERNHKCPSCRFDILRA
jgi:hypothetical protein